MSTTDDDTEKGYAQQEQEQEEDDDDDVVMASGSAVVDVGVQRFDATRTVVTSMSVQQSGRSTSLILDAISDPPVQWERDELQARMQATFPEENAVLQREHERRLADDLLYTVFMQPTSRRVMAPLEFFIGPEGYMQQEYGRYLTQKPMITRQWHSVLENPHAHRVTVLFLLCCHMEKAIWQKVLAMVPMDRRGNAEALRLYLERYFPLLFQCNINVFNIGSLVKDFIRCASIAYTTGGCGAAPRFTEPQIIVVHNPNRKKTGTTAVKRGAASTQSSGALFTAQRDVKTT